MRVQQKCDTENVRELEAIRAARKYRGEDPDKAPFD